MFGLLYISRRVMLPCPRWHGYRSGMYMISFFFYRWFITFYPMLCKGGVENFFKSRLCRHFKCKTIFNQVKKGDQWNYPSWQGYGSWTSHCCFCWTFFLLVYTVDVEKPIKRGIWWFYSLHGNCFSHQCGEQKRYIEMVGIGGLT